MAASLFRRNNKTNCAAFSVRHLKQGCEGISEAGLPGWPGSAVGRLGFGRDALPYRRDTASGAVKCVSEHLLNLN